jgi:septal ring factor EnvC (AmiA/AmiB activator)
VLVAGSVLAVAAAFGPAWAARAGVGIAVAAAVLACVFAWRELFDAQRSHARSMLAASQRHGAQLRDERQHNASVVETLTGRVRDATRVVDGQRVTITALRHEVFALEGDRTTLRGQLQQRDKVISWLRSTVRSQDAELTTLRTQLQVQEDERAAAEVHRLPRRVRAEFAAVEESDVTELPTFASVLPNYEVDRRLA